MSTVMTIKGNAIYLCMCLLHPSNILAVRSSKSRNLFMTHHLNSHLFDSDADSDGVDGSFN